MFSSLKFVTFNDDILQKMLFKNIGYPINHSSLLMTIVILILQTNHSYTWDSDRSFIFRKKAS